MKSFSWPDFYEFYLAILMVSLDCSDQNKGDRGSLRTTFWSFFDYLAI